MASFIDKIASFSGACLIYEDTSYTYKDLCERIEQKGRLLENLPQGSTIAILGDYDIDSISMLFACYEHTMIVAPLVESSQNKEALQEAEIEYIYANNTLSATGLKRTNSLFTRLQNVSGLILFSSGSTGKPKVIVHNLDTLLESYLQKPYNPTKTLSIFLPDHVAGIDVMFSVFSTGGSLIIPKARTPRDILQAIEKYKVEILPAPPTMLRLLLLSDMQKYSLDSLKLVIYGSEKMHENLLKVLQEILPNTRFKQSFGTSETNAIKTKNHETQEGYFKILNCEYKILNNELFLKSKTQTLGYLNADNSVFDKDGYFATGDLVEVIEVNGEEYLKILGRTKEVINVGGEKVLPNEVEGILLEIPYIQDCLVYGEPNAITGQSVSVKVVLDSTKRESANLTNAELKKRLRIYCKDRLAAYKIPTKVEIVESLAVSQRFKKMRGTKQ
ncbi:fatty acid--CoA ligase family protein [uncultured Helicobacter sp.]|uniref:ANL family adenylate-forming protein n=1 Tax=uncultured Helicobacter sp. TaxID=175537 RepID=UPI00374FDACF